MQNLYLYQLMRWYLLIVHHGFAYMFIIFKNHSTWGNLTWLHYNKYYKVAMLKNLCKLIVSYLKEITGMDNYNIATKLIYVGANGASVMQGHKNGLCIKLQINYASYMISIHCMVHRINLSYKIVSNFNNVLKV